MQFSCWFGNTLNITDGNMWHFFLCKALRITDGEEPLPQIMVDGKADGEVLIVLINLLSLQNFQLIIK